MASEVIDASGSAIDPGRGIQPREGSLARPEVAPVLVLGLGNLLLKDDGVGLELLRRLRERWRAERPQPCEVEFVDGGTQGVALLHQLAGRRALLILDAVSLSREPGCVVVVRDPLEQVAPQDVGAHGANASGLLASAMLVGDLPDHAVVVGVSPEELTTGIGLSESTRDALPEALAAAEKILAELCQRVGGGVGSQGGRPCTS